MLACDVGNRQLQRAAAIVSAALSAGLAGCTSDPPKPIEVNDSHASVVSARVVWRPGTPEPGRAHGGLEIDYSRHRGGGAQTIGSGERIDLGGLAEFLGPQTIQHEVEVRYVHVVYNWLVSTKWRAGENDRVDLEFLAGLGQTALALKAYGSAPAASQIDYRISSGGVALGISPRWWFSERFAAEGRLSYMTNLVDERTSMELALAFRPVKHFLLRAGYNSTVTDFGSPGDYVSNVNTTLRGPFLGLALDF